MADIDERLVISIEKDGKRIATESSVVGKRKIVVVINNQFTNSPNTTQIASGAGRNSAAGSNAAIDSSNTLQQQSVGAAGRARNLGMKGSQSEPHDKHGNWKDDEELTIVINNQINKTGKRTSSATQVASGGGIDSAGGTNAAIQSSNTKQQHAVGGDKSGRALNKGQNNKQKEVRSRKSSTSRR
ncbi:hypothetical protein NZD89_03095 [Alicyclobacillus fastidiosus]|uniref:Uncharacterized protein n=1 Tax=Alicyclobacillus fastidiosus TaxID=392011 RepID=A0ABY6ZJX7_9BACL|nr:hypothetical protein [Alicyclobacillus fastidiosus]WAH42471.1 hypothetical protein NZD89_02940 [Alicyclobacillus fastidiosus]WAH42492.1 hypothetical protein NZD89_03095 [Alicyclobacillus fastidiosus]GMA64304.1 hypothetical protein GCM10025859_47440 [Alicyclobacillus fastidiosus]GMA64331.1 hypothetical protein GCM10025859_47710 [Alicyclobacillus fastidiosus]